MDTSVYGMLDGEQELRQMVTNGLNFLMNYGP